MVDQVKFLRELADLVEKHDVALCAKAEGPDSASVYFIAEPYNFKGGRVRFHTGRSHSSAYELRCIATNIEIGGG